MATFYFNGAVDGEWTELGNWWLTDPVLPTPTPATSLPASSDSVIALASISTNSGSAPTVVNFTMNSPDYRNPRLSIALTVTGFATFNHNAWLTNTITGNAVFNNSSHNLGSVSGTATFTGTAANGGTAGVLVPSSPPKVFYFNGADDIANNIHPTDWQNLGNWWMNDTFTTPATGLPTSTDSVIIQPGSGDLGNSGSEPTVANLTLSSLLQCSVTVTGVCTFNGSGSVFFAGHVTGDCTFNDNSYMGGTVTGNCTFNDSSYSAGTVTGNCTFNDSTVFQQGTITGDCTFNDSSYFGGDTAITGNCTFNDSAVFSANWDYGNPNAIPNVTGDCIFNDSSYVQTGLIDGNGTFNHSSYNSGGFFLEDCTFNDSTYMGSGNITGDCTLNDNSYMGGGNITGDCTLNDNSYMGGGTVNGVARFRPTSAAIQIAGSEYGSFTPTFSGSVEVIYDKGVNGSSILGVV